MGLADLFEFKTKEKLELGGMTEEEFKKKATLAIHALRRLCRKLGGDFRAHSPYSATCWLPEEAELANVRVVDVRKGGVVLREGTHVEIFPTRVSEFLDLVAEEGAKVYVGSTVFERGGVEVAELYSRGGEIRGRLKVKSISIRTDPYEKYINVEIL